MDQSRDDAARLAALEAQQESTRSQLLGLDRKVEQGFGQVRDAIDKLRVSFQQEIDVQRERSKAPVWQIVSAIMTTVTILLVVFGMVQANNNEDHTELKASIIAVQTGTVDMVDRMYDRYLEPTFTDLKDEQDQIENRVRAIETTRSTDDDRYRVEEKIQSLIERVSHLEASLP